MNAPDPARLITTALGLRVGVVALTLLVSRRPRAARIAAFTGSALASLLTGVAGALVLAGHPMVTGLLAVHHASGATLGFTLDGLAAWFLVVLALLACPIAIFSIDYVGHVAGGRRSPFLGIAFTVLCGAVELVFLADGLVAFLFAWELMTLTNAALVATEHESRETRRAALLYLVMSHIGTGCLIAGFLTLAAQAGSPLFSAMLAGNVVSGVTRHALFGLFLIGFGIKAGFVPLHVWLPEAHPAAPSHISAIMSGVIIKTGIYGIVRVCAFGLGTPDLWWGVLVLALGGLSSILGVLYALMQHDLKRLLAYHSIENIGIILLGLGAGLVALAAGHGDLAAVGVAASLFHVLNHAIFKGLLFLGAGAVVTATGTRQIEHLGGLLRRMPWTGAAFLVGALAISGLPPLNGFASEWLTFQAFLYGFHVAAQPLVYAIFPVAGALLALTTALAAACFVKAFGITFLALPRSAGATQATDCGRLMRWPQAVLAALCLVLGVMPGGVVSALTVVMRSLPGLQPPPEMAASATRIAPGPGSFDQISPVVLAVALTCAFGLTLAAVTRRRGARRVVPTWGCGGELGPQTEYTATAFSKPLMLIFRAIYRPTRRVDALAEVSPYFPSEVRYRAEIEPTFERFVYGPLTRAAFRAAERMKLMQAGSLHAYLAYVIALVLTLVLLVWWQG